MTPSENRTLLRSSLVLLVASGLRLGWGIGSSEVPIINSGTNDLPEVAVATDSAIAREERRTRPLEPGERIDLNTADSLELQRLPRVGPAMARAILETRSARGGIRTWHDLDAVPGVGDATLERLRPSIEPLQDGDGRVGGRSPAPDTPLALGGLNMNRADSAAWVALPGIGPAKLEQLRPFLLRGQA